MTIEETLAEVKNLLGITTNFQDAIITGYIKEVKLFLIDAGVDPEVVNSVASLGVISRGVTDLWNFGAGEGKLSVYFYQRAIQLKNTKIN